MGLSKGNASSAWYDIESATLISSDVKDTWQNILHFPAPPTDPDPNATSPSIAGLAQGVLTTIGAFKAAGALASDPSFLEIVQTYFEFMESVDLSAIFGGG